jgi:hypothetical protein
MHSAPRIIDQWADSAAPNPKQATNVTTSHRPPLGVSPHPRIDDFFPPLTSFCTLFWLFWGAKKGPTFLGSTQKKSDGASGRGRGGMESSIAASDPNSFAPRPLRERGWGEGGGPREEGATGEAKKAAPFLGSTQEKSPPLPFPLRGRGVEPREIPVTFPTDYSQVKFAKRLTTPLSAKFA